MLPEEKVYAMIQLELDHAKSNSFCRTLVLQIIKYSEFFDEFRITSAEIARKLDLPQFAYAQIALARAIFKDLKRSGLNAQQL